MSRSARAGASRGLKLRSGQMRRTGTVPACSAHRAARQRKPPYR